MKDIKILAIDDSIDILFTIKAICDIENWTTITTTDGSQACELINTHHPDLVIVDYRMPIMNGIDVVQNIRMQDDKTPILVLTVEEDPFIAKKITEAGANDYALKPIKAIDLISRIKVHVRKSKPKKSKYFAYKKGINKHTLDLVLEALRKEPDFLTVEEISEASGLVCQTVNRYLVYLNENELVEVIFEYGKKGRPRQKYRLKSR
jgi:two-component system, CitB family, response regulator DctR